MNNIKDLFWKVVERGLQIWFAWFIFLIIFWNLSPILAWIFIIVYTYRKFSKR